MNDSVNSGDFSDPDPAWLRHARAALANQLEGDHEGAALAIVNVLNSPDSPDAPPVAVGAALHWVDALFAVAPPPPHMTNPKRFPPDMTAETIWAMRLFTAHANGNGKAINRLFREIASSNEQLVEHLVALLTLIAFRLRGAEAARSRSSVPGRFDS